jgi:hypothetical protein
MKGFQRFDFRGESIDENRKTRFQNGFERESFHCKECLASTNTILSRGALKIWVWRPPELESGMFDTPYGH